MPSATTKSGNSASSASWLTSRLRPRWVTAAQSSRTCSPSSSANERVWPETSSTNLVPSSATGTRARLRSRGVLILLDGSVARPAQPLPTRLRGRVDRQREDRVDLGEIRRRRGPRRRGGGVGGDLLGRRRAGDDAAQAGLREQPAERRLEHRDAPLVAEPPVGVQRVPRCGLVDVPALTHDATVGRCALTRELAGEQAVVQREVREESDSEPL